MSNDEMPKVDEPYDPRNFKLETMMNNQYILQRDTYGIDYFNMTDEERIHHFKEMLHAFNDEMHEALGEMGWKPWASSRHFNTPAVQGELVDAWHFFMNLMLIAKMTPLDLYEKYDAKRRKNMQRQADGYDGVSTKCPKCRRALDDDAVNCHYQGRADSPGKSLKVYCCHYESEGTIIYV